jgi:hypothetical protein
MAYVSNSLRLVAEPIAGTVPRLFYYHDVAAESNATLVGAGYFSDGVKQGMRVGDLLDVVQTPTVKYKRYQVASVSGAAATVAAPTAITG